MNFTVVLKDEAIQDLREAYDWYEQRKHGLGSKFLDHIDLHLQKITSNPDRFSASRGQRELIMTTFPFQIIFHVQENSIIVLGVFHQRLNPSDH